MYIMQASLIACKVIARDLLLSEHVKHSLSTLSTGVSWSLAHLSNYLSASPSCLSWIALSIKFMSSCCTVTEFPLMIEWLFLEGDGFGFSYLSMLILLNIEPSFFSCRAERFTEISILPGLLSFLGLLGSCFYGDDLPYCLLMYRCALSCDILYTLPRSVDMSY